MLLQQFEPNATAVSADDVYAALVKATPQGLTVLEKSTAENKDAVVVTKATADANNLKSIADLAPVASTFVLGGPPEWETRPTGVPGLKEKYGLTFKEFKAAGRRRPADPERTARPTRSRRATCSPPTPRSRPTTSWSSRIRRTCSPRRTCCR